MFEFGILGPLQVTQQGQPVQLTAPKQRTLLAVLLIHPNEAVSTDRLIDALWGEAPPSAARRTLRYHVSKLRDVLDPDRLKGDEANWLLVTEGQGYRLQLDPIAIDAVRFEREFEAGRTSTVPVEASTRLRSALALWRGPVLADFEYEEFASAEIARLEELRTAATEARIAAEVAAGQSGELVGELESLVAQHPYRERLWALLMTALYRSGRQAEALQAYQTARKVLGEELGIDPSPELRELEERILLQDQSLTEPDPETSLPTGAVTFLFTDIAGSTRKWDENPEAMRAALGTHDDIERAAIAEHAGHVFKHTGDGLAAVFRSAMDGVSAAISIQARIRQAEWDAVGGLEVKQALTTGEVDPSGGDYFGPTVNLASRMADIAYGGQMLLDEATAGIARGLLPAGWVLDDMGLHQIRHISRPTTIYQLRSSDDQTPPARPLAGSLRHNLPQPITSFVGRERELIAIKRAVATTRLVTLTGIGGIGKTRLAIETAAGLLDDFEHGVFHVSVAEVDSLDQLIDVLGLSLHLAVEHSPTALIQALRDREMLVLLDGMELLWESSALFVTELLERCPRVRVLATSRIPPDIGGGVVWPVPPLIHAPADATEPATWSDAAGLFQERARLVDADFEITADNAALVNQLVGRLEGIPLALELAAARLKLLSLEDIVAASNRAVPGGSRTFPTAGDRHRSLAASIGWSLSLLGDQHRRLFGGLAIFRGGFDLEAARGICGHLVLDDDALLNGLDMLVDSSLLRVDHHHGVRYAMLEAVRRHTIEHTAATDQPSGDLHAAYFADLAEQAYDLLAGPEAHEWLLRLIQDRANLEAAVSWVLATGDGSRAVRLVGNLGRFWLAAGYRSSAQQWLYRVDPSPVSIDAARVIAGRVSLAMEQGNLTEMARHADALSAMAAGLEDPGMYSEATKWQGNVLLLRGKTEAAASRFEDASGSAVAAGHPYATVPTVWLGWASIALGRWDRAEACGNWLLDQNVRQSEAWRIIGRSEMGRGAPDAALRAFERSVHAADEAPLPLERIHARLDIAAAAHTEANNATARQWGREARNLAEEVGADALRNAALRLLIATAREMDDEDEAIRLEAELARTSAAEQDVPRQQVILPGEGPLFGWAE